MKKKNEDNAINKFIRERIKEARKNAGETQGKLAKFLDRSNVAISDIESGKTAVNAALLVQIAMHYRKSISYFYPEEATIKLTKMEEEIINLFQQLPTLEQYKEIDNLREKIKKQKWKKGK